jgi:predicted PurR-regulated permease PerM
MNEEKKVVYINITWQGILKIIAVLAVVYLLFLIKSVLAVLFVAFLLSSALSPAVDWLQKRKIPRVLAAVVIYLAAIFLMGLSAYFFLPSVAREVIDFSKNSPEYISKISSGLSSFGGYSDVDEGSATILDDLKSIGADWQGAAGKTISILARIFGGILSFVLIIVLTFYMLVEDGILKKLILTVMPAQKRVYALDLAGRIEEGVGRWLRGQLLLSAIIFIVIYVGLLIIGVKHALLLALIAGLAEFIPYLGPLIASIPALLLSFAQAPMLAIFVAGLYYLTHWLEGHIIVPQVMGRIVGLNPIIIIAVMLSGFKIAGLVGTILAIPVATAANIIIRYIIERKSLHKEVIE